MKIAVLGNGIEGKSVLEYFEAKGDEVEMFDEKDGGKFEEMNFDGFDMIFRSPSVKPDKVKNANMTSVTRYFFEKCPAKIIGVTGTKGKGTTCSLIKSILDQTGRKAWLVGNIGVAALGVLDEISENDIVVYELSSFQLWDMKKSPQIAVVVHMEQDHMDVHETMDNYIAAKSNIVVYQNEEDIVIFDKTNKISTEVAGLSQAQKWGYPTGDYGEILNSLLIPGEHNRLNGEAAILAVKAVGVTDPEMIKKGLGAFSGLPHRLKFVEEWKDVKYYDDSISTTPGSAIAAIRAFSEPKVLILGGSDKGASYGELALAVKNGNVRSVILVGPEGKKIREELVKVGFWKFVQVYDIPYDMEYVVKMTTYETAPGDIVILSPACASFDSFDNYAQRGDKFVAAVKDLDKLTDPNKGKPEGF